ncbi:MAG: hypothetical protein K6E86_02065 [Bacteroidales bacterium]|nr:hypothetical protein [Bacteroidales bacterium]
MEEVTTPEDAEDVVIVHEKIKSGYADEAGHAMNADEATHAAEADDATCWAGEDFSDWLDQPVRKRDEVRHPGIRSASEFIDGLTGSGFRMWMDENGKARLTVDKLTVRQSMTVMELLVQKIRSVGGAIVVSAANGRIKTVTEQEEVYQIVFEETNSFLPGDLIRCSTWSGNGLKDYWVEVASVESDNTVVVAKEAFGTSVPAEGDECVLMGSRTNAMRQNLLLLSATEDGQPRLDILNGVKSTSLDGCLRARLGNLDGISDNWFPADNQPQGDGLYADNVYLKGSFLLENGDDVKTRFEATEGLIESSVEGLRQDVMDAKGYLSNATFGSGMDNWRTENEAVFYLLGNKWIWVNNNVLSKLGNSAVVVNDMGRKVVHIRNKFIQQLNDNLRTKPAIETQSDGLKSPVPVYLSFYYRCASAGTLNVTFENVDTTGFEDFTSMNVEEEIAVTEGYEQFTCNGLWNGTGDFKLSFSGDIYLYMLVLSTDKTEALAYQYRTLFQQTERLVKICAAVFDKNATALSETGLFVKPEGAGIYVQNSDGTVALLGVNDDGTIKLQATNIQLEGLVTANGNFKILEDGSIEATNGKFTGEVQASSGSIGGFTIDNELKWEQAAYLGGVSKSLQIGLPSVDTEGVVDIFFSSASQGRYGIKVTGSNMGGAGVFSSRYSTPQNTPNLDETYAGFFDGGVTVCGNLIAESFCSKSGENISPGITQTIEVADYTLTFQNGILIGVQYNGSNE